MRTVLVLAMLLVAAAWADAGPALAAGLPQLDASKYPSMVIWLAISFAVLYVLMAKVTLPRIAQVLEKRQDRIDDNLEKATGLKAEAEAAADGIVAVDDGGWRRAERQRTPAELPV